MGLKAVFNKPRDTSPSSQRPKSSDPEHTEHGVLDVDMGAMAIPGNGFTGEGGQNYRTMGRWDTVLVLLTNQIGLGFLSLPGVIADLGLIPGIIAIVGIGCLTWYTAYVLGQFYNRYPHVVNIVEMARVEGGRRFEIVAGIALLIQIVMTSAATCVTISIALNTISNHALCTVGFMGPDLPLVGSAVLDLTTILPIIETTMDGTSGALYAIFLNALLHSFKNKGTGPATPEVWASALEQSSTTLSRYTPARVGDRTVVDALEPFIQKLVKTKDLVQAAEAARNGAESTIGMQASLGRSVYVGGSGLQQVPDPGAWGLSEFLIGFAGLDRN